MSKKQGTQPQGGSSANEQRVSFYLELLRLRRKLCRLPLAGPMLWRASEEIIHRWVERELRRVEQRGENQ